MKNGEIQHLNSLKEIHQKRLRILQKQAANYGDFAVPPHIEIEIDEIKKKILDIDARLNNISISGENLFLDDQQDLVTLRSKLFSHFNLEELRTLCFDLGVDAENFPALKEGFTRELTQHFFRNGNISELVSYCQKKRPKVSW